MAVLTIHHWSDWGKGLEELRRVARRRIVLLTYDPSARPWLVDYLPELAILDERHMPTITQLRECLGEIAIHDIPIPHDCTDGFLYAYWRRPVAYLDERLRKGSSSFSAIKGADAGLERLHSDLESGEWERRYAELLDMESYDAGYRLIVANAA